MRSLLYVPADNAAFIAKAHLRGADCVILDLEDSVAPDRKDGARSRLAEAADSLRRGDSRVAVRINAGDMADVDAALSAGVDWLVCPKADRDSLDALAAHLGLRGASLPVLATVETPSALFDLKAIAHHPVVAALNLGSEDFAAAIGARPDPDVLRPPKLMVHYAAKAAGKLSLGLLRSIAGYTDLEGMHNAAAEARRHGFDGATCIHPSAVAVLNKGFLPGEAEIAWAIAVLATEGTTALDGQMIDRPVRIRAEAILRSAADPDRKDV